MRDFFHTEAFSQVNKRNHAAPQVHHAFYKIRRSRDCGYIVEPVDFPYFLY